MTLMPDFEHDIQVACERWHRPRTRALRKARPLLPVGAVAAAIALVIALVPGTREREADLRLPSALPAPAQVNASGAERVSLPDDVREFLTKNADSRSRPAGLDLDNALEFPVPPGQDVPGGPGEEGPNQRWFLVRGAQEDCAVFGSGSACGEFSAAFEEARSRSSTATMTASRSSSGSCPTATPLSAPTTSPAFRSPKRPS